MGIDWIETIFIIDGNSSKMPQNKSKISLFFTIFSQIEKHKPKTKIYGKSVLKTTFLSAF